MSSRPQITPVLLNSATNCRQFQRCSHSSLFGFQNVGQFRNFLGRRGNSISYFAKYRAQPAAKSLQAPVGWAQSRDPIHARSFPQPISFFCDSPLDSGSMGALDDLRIRNDMGPEVSTDCASSW